MKHVGADKNPLIAIKILGEAITHAVDPVNDTQAPHGLYKLMLERAAPNARV
jgi:hypothetical protein